ncbi:MAG: GDP-mannose 4,6-dehydratase [Coriobacteriia bacterium]|nr:GDP-mannose 4,6-dehydratase [Coriobacteriia bacterium]
MVAKKALITGITGQDGAYLSRLLIDKGYEVHGIVRRSSDHNTARVDQLRTDSNQQAARLNLHFGDLTDSAGIMSIVESVQPDEIYNLGAQSQVDISFSTPLYTADVDGLGTLRLLEAVRVLGLANTTRIYQASTSDLYGKGSASPKCEQTPFEPNSPYGIAKLYSYWTCVNYREAYDMYVCNGILFNHESPLRGENFVTRKISSAVARIKLGKQDVLQLGNLDATRDFGFAGDYVELMWLMLQQDAADDYVMATGKLSSVREFARAAFAHVGIELRFEGSGLDERGIDAASGKTLLTVSKEFFRPTDVDLLVGDASKARQQLGWTPSTTLQELTAMMVDFDLQREQNL